MWDAVHFEKCSSVKFDTAATVARLPNSENTCDRDSIWSGVLHASEIGVT